MAIATPANTEPRINDRIRAREVRLIGAEGNQLGIKALPEALSLARSQDLDLVEVADKANPPVCRIMDYGKYRYEAAQKAKESRRKSTNVVVKEMKYRPKIGTGDFDTKTKKVEKFLGEGHKVKVTIMFRGREMQHPELGRKILDHVAEHVAHVGRVETFPKQDGRNMTMVLGPDKKAQAAAVRRKEGDEGAPDTGAAPAASAPAPSARPPAARPPAARPPAQPPAARPAAPAQPSAPRPAAPAQPSAPRPAAQPSAPRPAAQPPAARPSAPAARPAAAPQARPPGPPPRPTGPPPRPAGGAPRPPGPPPRPPGPPPRPTGNGTAANSPAAADPA